MHRESRVPGDRLLPGSLDKLAIATLVGRQKRRRAP
jgi:hypothetical protein